MTVAQGTGLGHYTTLSILHMFFRRLALGGRL